MRRRGIAGRGRNRHSLGVRYSTRVATLSPDLPAEDAHQPRKHAPTRLEALRVLEGREERLLERVLRLTRVARERQREAEEGKRRHIEQPAERLRFSGLDVGSQQELRRSG